MGWEPEIRVWLNEIKEPLTTFSNLARHIESSQFFGRLLRLRIWQHRHIHKNVIKDIKLENFNTTEIQGLLSRFADQTFNFEAWWETHSSYEYATKEIYGKWRTEIVEKIYRMVISIPGNQYLWSGNPNDVNMILEIGKEVYLSPHHQGELAELNILSLICQLSYLVEFGISKMHLLNRDSAINPRTFHLAYHQNVDGFREDLAAWTQYILPQPQLTNNQVILILKSCEDIDYTEVGGGILVFNKNLVDGSLESFYTKIIEFLENC